MSVHNEAPKAHGHVERSREISSSLEQGGALVTCPRPHPRRRGFTLFELLMVMLVISILAAMLLGGITQAIHFSRRAATRHEVRMLASAWQQYYSQYKAWPTNMVSPEGIVELSGDVVRLLQGTLPEEDENVRLNPRRIRFMEFDRFNSQGDPVTLIDPVAGLYYSRFDLDFDNQIDLPEEYTTETNTVNRSVIAWTIDPQRTPGEDGYIIGSWE